MTWIEKVLEYPFTRAYHNRQQRKTRCATLLPWIALTCGKTAIGLDVKVYIVRTLDHTLR